MIVRSGIIFLGKFDKRDGSRNGSGYRCQSDIGIRVCAKQTLANGLFNERERLRGLSPHWVLPWQVRHERTPLL